MPTSKVIEEASSPLFCKRVAFIALRMAHAIAKDTPDDPVAMAYVQHVMRGNERAALLALHVAAVSDPISAALGGEGGAEAVVDADIEAALKEIWAARTAAFGASDNHVQQMVRLAGSVMDQVAEAKNAVAEVRQAAETKKVRGDRTAKPAAT